MYWGACSHSTHSQPYILGFTSRKLFSVAGTEISYCLLSLIAKLYLGCFLLINVIAVDGTVDDTLRGTNEVRR